MLIPRTPLQAYLLDTAEPLADASADQWLTGCVAFGAALERAISVIRIGTALHGAPSTSIDALSAAEGGVFERERQELHTLAVEYVLVAPGTGTSTKDVADGADGICALARRVASAAEQRGALQSSYTLLVLLDGLSSMTSPVEYGRVLAHRARIARKGDSLAVAEGLYRRVAVLAKETSSDELRARALIGRGVLAHSKGNYPAARRCYTQAARSAKKSGDASLVRHAYHGLMVVAAKYGELGQAFKAGWLAFQGAAGDPEAEADILINLAQLAFDAGEARAALHGFAAALARNPAPWRLLPALGGAARAAAALGDWSLVEVCANRVDTFDTSSSFAYSRAVALWDVARAFAVGDQGTSALAFATRAHTLAITYGFHELSLESERLIEASVETRRRTQSRNREPARAETRPVIDSGGYTVLRRLTSLESPERVLALL